MRIHVNKIDNNQPIFGALIPNFTIFLKVIEESGKNILIFKTEKHGEVYCDVIMARRIADRQKLNGLDDSVIMDAINLFQLT